MSTALCSMSTEIWDISAFSNDFQLREKYLKQKILKKINGRILKRCWEKYNMVKYQCNLSGLMMKKMLGKEMWLWSFILNTIFKIILSNSEILRILLRQKLLPHH